MGTRQPPKLWDEGVILPPGVTLERIYVLDQVDPIKIVRSDGLPILDPRKPRRDGHPVPRTPNPSMPWQPKQPKRRWWQRRLRTVNEEMGIGL